MLTTTNCNLNTLVALFSATALQNVARTLVEALLRSLARVRGFVGVGGYRFGDRLPRLLSHKRSRCWASCAMAMRWLISPASAQPVSQPAKRFDRRQLAAARRSGLAIASISHG